MNHEQFWNLIESARADTKANDAYEALENLLEPLPMIDLLEFTQIYGTHQKGLFSPAHLASAFLLNEGTLSDESFMIYTEGLVAAPKIVYFDISNSPDRILDHPVYKDVLNLDGYPFAVAAIAIGERIYGNEWHLESKKKCWKQDPVNIDEIVFEGRYGWKILDEATCQRLVPRILARYGSLCDWR